LAQIENPFAYLLWVPDSPSNWPLDSLQKSLMVRMKCG